MSNLFAVGGDIVKEIQKDISSFLRFVLQIIICKQAFICYATPIVNFSLLLFKSLLRP